MVVVVVYDDVSNEKKKREENQSINFQACVCEKKEKSQEGCLYVEESIHDVRN